MGFIFPVSNDFYSKVKMAQDHYEFVFKTNIGRVSFVQYRTFCLQYKQ